MGNYRRGSYVSQKRPDLHKKTLPPQTSSDVVMHRGPTHSGIAVAAGVAAVSRDECVAGCGRKRSPNSPYDRCSDCHMELVTRFERLGL